MKWKWLLIGWIAVLLLVPACQGNAKRSSFSLPDRNSEELVEIQVATATPSSQCTEEDPHPMGVSISDKFQVDYEQVMTWYCGGDAFSDILLALETAKLTDDVEADELLQRLEDETWEVIWSDLGVSPE